MIETPKVVSPQGPKTGQKGAKTDSKGSEMIEFDPNTAQNDPTEPIPPYTVYMTENSPPGRMLTAVETDLARMEQMDKGVRGSLAALARELARAMDATGDDRPTPAQVGQLGAQLRVTLNSLANLGGDTSVAEKFFEIMSTAVGSVSDTDDTPRHKGRAGKPRTVPVPGLEDGDGDQ